MAVPTKMQDLSTLAASNSPQGSETLGNSLDDYIRALSAICRSTNALASASMASASTVNVANADGESVNITGTATISSLGTGFNGCYRELRFAGALTLTHSTNLKLPGGANVTTAAGDIAGFRCTGSGVWEMTAFSRITKDSLGLGNVDNTSDANKPVSTATQTALDQKAPLSSPEFTGLITVDSSSPRAVFKVSGTEAGRIRAESSALVMSAASGTIYLRPNGDTNPAGQLTVSASGEVAVSGELVADTFFRSVDDSVGLAPASAGTIYLRPNGKGSTTGQTTIDSSGKLTIGGGKGISKVTVSSSAPGTLADGELYLRY